MVTGPTGAASTVTGPTGAQGPTGSAVALGNLTVTDQTISGTDVNGDIVLNPNGFGNTVVFGNLLISGTDGLLPQQGTSNALIHVQGKDGTSASIVVDAFTDNTTSGPGFTTRRYGGTSSVPTAALVGQAMGAMVSRGYNGSGITTSAFAGIIMRAAENFSLTNQGSDVEVWTTPVASNVATVAARFTNNGLTVGNIVLSGSNITLTNSAQNLSIGTVGQTGNLVIYSTLQVVDANGNVTLTNTASGQIDVVSGYSNPDKSAVLNIVGNWTNSFRAPTNAGGMIQITGHDGTTSRVINDSYVTSATSYSAYVGRKANGTAASPSATQAGALARFTGAAYTPTLGFNATAFAPVYMSYELLATATDSSTPTRIVFAATPVGSINSVLVANVDTTGITLPYAGSGLTFPDGSRQTSAGGASNVVVINGPTYSMTNRDRFVGVNYAVAPITLTLPQTVTCVLGATIVVKDTGPNATAQHITINAYAGDTIDGASNVIITQNYNSYTLIYSAANAWSII